MTGRDALLFISLCVLAVAGAGCGESTDTEATAVTTTTTGPVAETTADPEPATTAAPAPTVGSTTLTGPADTSVLEVPPGPAPFVDGTVDPAEWKDAVPTLMDDGTELRWLHADGLLYLGVIHDTVAAVNLVVSDGDRVRVLHSSAALGSAVYQRRDDGTWRLQHDFEWCCRRTDDTASVDALLAEEGWLASTGFAGEPGDVEYLLAMDGPSLRIAVSVVEADGTAAFWPVDLDAEAREPLFGRRRETETFATNTWMLVVVDE